MKQFLQLTCITVVVLMLSFVQANDFPKLYMLQGTWGMHTKHGSICEEWKLVNKDYLQSRGYYVKAGDTIVNETVALQNRADGIFYTSTVMDQNGGRAIPFKLTASINSRFVFENPAHDFPKRIVYELVGKDSIHALIDDGNDASSKRSHFYYSRIK